MWQPTMLLFPHFVKSLLIIGFLKQGLSEEQALNIFTFKMFPLHLCKLFIRHICLHSKQERADHFHRPEQPLWLGEVVPALNCRLRQVRCGAVNKPNGGWCGTSCCNSPPDWSASSPPLALSGNTCVYPPPPPPLVRVAAQERNVHSGSARRTSFHSVTHRVAYYHRRNCTRHPALHAGTPSTAAIRLPLSVSRPRARCRNCAHTR